MLLHAFFVYFMKQSKWWIILWTISVLHSNIWLVTVVSVVFLCTLCYVLILRMISLLSFSFSWPSIAAKIMLSLPPSSLYAIKWEIILILNSNTNDQVIFWFLSLFSVSVWKYVKEDKSIFFKNEYVWKYT